MKYKKLTISIGISAYNEAENIQQLLQSIVMQKQTNFSLDTVVIISDGSTDETVKKANDIRGIPIRVLDEKKRMGKIARLTELFKLINSDLIIILDADTILSSETTVEQLVKPFYQDPAIVFVSGHAIPHTGKT